MKSIYLDYNATTPIDREVADAMAPFLYEHFGNPSSIHPYGVKTRLAVEQARIQISELINCQPSEIIFTSGGTESNNYAIKGVSKAYQNKGNHIITSSIEHPAVLEVYEWLEEEGFRISILPVDKHGLVDPEDLEKVINDKTILVSIMHANNEVGTIQPLKELSDIAHRNGAFIHTDAAQSIGKIPVDVDELGVDLLSIAGHKVYAPKGIGALFIRHGVKLEKFMHGAEHEANHRAGTENVLEIVGLGKACEIAKRDLTKNIKHYKKMRDDLYEGLKAKIGNDKIKLNGHSDQRLPNTLNVSFYNIEANTLLSEITEEVSASAGAACHAESVEVSPVLDAMQIPVDWAMGTIRFSVGRGNTQNEITRAVSVISDTVLRLSSKADITMFPNKVKGNHIKLTSYTHGLGCACKLRPQMLEEVLKKLTPGEHPNILIGPETSDDAAVYKINDSQAIVQTVDFFTPIVDDPYSFGAISAANSLSDIYAMGAQPLFALNIVGFPSNRLSIDVLESILIGAQDKAIEAGISIIGGHTVDDTEPKYGLAVTGIVHPEQIIRNNTSQVGDTLILTKPLGFGIISTAMKRGLVDQDTTQNVIQWMTKLNKTASELCQNVGVNAMTDITGFGLLGHLLEMTRGSQVNVELQSSDIPILQAARTFAGANIIPGGSLDNLSFVDPFVVFNDTVSQVDRYILADAQTSGGLLISCPQKNAAQLLNELQNNGVESASMIGHVIKNGKGLIQIY